MFRALLSCLFFLGFAAFSTADDKKTEPGKTEAGKKNEATITKIDAKNHAVTVKMKDKEGKEVEKTFKLTETVKYVDSTGKVAAIDIFKSGDMVLVVEAEGQLKEMHQKKETAPEKK